jgi:hypothetical protein
MAIDSENKLLENNHIEEIKEDTKHEINNIVLEDEERIKYIIEQYRKKITNYIQPNDEKGLHEIYNWLKTRNVDANKYIIDAIDIFSRKDQEVKKNIGYLINIIRNWVSYGYGYMPTKEDNLICDLFEKSLNVKLSYVAKNKLINLLSDHGLINLSFLIGRELTNIQNVDMSIIYVTKLEKLIEDNN